MKGKDLTFGNIVFLTCMYIHTVVKFEVWLY